MILVSLPKDNRSLRAIAGGWTSRAALLGVGSGTAFGLAAVGYRGAALALDTPSIVLAAAYSLVWAQAWQTLLLGGWLLWRQRRVVVAVLLAWRVSMLAGAMGAIGSACWFTAMALEPVANVRTLGLIELFFSYLVSRRFFRERLTPPNCSVSCCWRWVLSGLSASSETGRRTRSSWCRVSQSASRPDCRRSTGSI